MDMKELAKHVQDTNRKKIRDIINASWKSDILSSFDTGLRIEKDFNIKLAENQKEVVETILDPNIPNVALTGARSGGKTFGVVTALTLASINGYQGEKSLKIGLTAPTEGQANRMISTFRTEIMANSPFIKSQVDLRLSGNTKIVFKNGSMWEAFSGNEVSSQEGRHYHALIMDEAQNISDRAVNQILLPMVRHSKNPKVVKLGVPRCKNHFFKSAHSSHYVHISHDWLHCPNLLNSGVLEVNGIKYPKAIYEELPYAVIQRIFPNNPELWHRDGSMLEEDFGTQYEMAWLLDADLLLNETNQGKLLGDFDFVQGTEEYFGGLDIAGGEQIKGGNCNTAASIGRIVNGIRQKVDAISLNGDSVEQIAELEHFFKVKYRCKFVMGDYGYNSAIIDTLKHNGVPIEGVLFGARDGITGKNMKNSMYDSMLFEIESERFKYPSIDYINKHKVLKQHYDEWCLLERHRKSGVNDVIIPAEGNLSDGPCSDILLNLAMTTAAKQVTLGGGGNINFPAIVKGFSTSEAIGQWEKRSERNEGNNGIGGNGGSSMFPKFR